MNLLFEPYGHKYILMFFLVYCNSPLQMVYLGISM